MDALKFIKEFKRMCNCCSGGFCAGCPRKENPSCDDSMMDDDELNKLIADVEKWSKEHPQKTRLQDFREKYPNALLYYDGTPIPCCSDLGYCKECPEGTTCEDCWNVPVEEDDE